MALDVVSLGTALTVPDSARDALAAANLIVGAQRHLDAIDSSGADTLIYPSPISELAAVIDANRERNLVVLASGDALFYGIGSFVLRHCGANKPRFHPNVTTLQSACARAGRTWQDIKVLSLHGRPLSRLRACLQAGVALAIFTDSTNAPSLIASELVECAFSDSSIAVVEALDTTRERIRSFSAGELAQSRDEFDSLNLLIVDVAGEGGLLPAFPGIDDAKFAEGGDTQFTKREVRLAALSRLQLKAGETGWDVGAGSGGIAIEWARWTPGAYIVAVERDSERRAFFEINRARYGDHGNLELIAGEAPEALAALAAPDAVYIGGSGGNLNDLLEFCWEALNPGGRLVVAGVTVETRAALQNRQWPGDVSFSEIAISHAAPLGTQTTMRSQLPVLLASIQKPRN